MKIDPVATDSADQPGNTPLARLRILETTDLHMQLVAYDYFADKPARQTGLIQLAGAIRELQEQSDLTCLLFDNGDFLQGNPLADYIADQGPSDRIHPMIAAMNVLGYDAITLGNHEFNYGLRYLESVLKHATFPVVSANVRTSDDRFLATPFTMIDRLVTCDDGVKRSLRVGIIGFVTPQIVDWGKAILDSDIQTDDIIAAAHAQIPLMKSAGADLIVALCHSGIGTAVHYEGMENAAIPLAAIPGIDVILVGHTHGNFPGDGAFASSIVDPDQGTLHGKPAVMAGFYGAYVGVIDLVLGWDSGRWHIADQCTRLQAGHPPTDKPSDLEQTLFAQVSDMHAATLTHILRPIAKTQVPIHSYFATVAPDLTIELMAKAQQSAIATALASTQYAGLPLLSAMAPFRVGGRGGASYYIDIAPGNLTLRDAAAIYPFNNTLCALRRTGAQIREWLERAAGGFLQIEAGVADQPLINQHSASYNFDTIFGLTYTFDLTQPPMFSPHNVRNPESKGRVRQLRYNGQPIKDDSVFVVATNSYRANGGGGLIGTQTNDILYATADSARDVLIKYLAKQGCINKAPSRIWGFVPIADTSVTFQSAPAAKGHMPAGTSHIGPAENGFDRYRIIL